jgi:DNA-binding NarL/FixJ family response regulator
MGRIAALDAVLRGVVENRAAVATETAAQLFEETGDAYVLALLSFTHFMSQRFDDAATTAARAIDESHDAEALMLARACAGLGVAGAGTVAGEDHLGDARRELSTLNGVEKDSAAFIRYLLAEAALACARLRLASEFVDNSPGLRGAFLTKDGVAHPYLVMMELMYIRLYAFQGRITEALAYAEIADAREKRDVPVLVFDATMCLVRGNAAEKTNVRVIAERLERVLPEARDYISSGCYLLVSYGLIATADIPNAARLVLKAGGDAGLARLTIIDRVLGLEMLTVAALADDDVVSAEAWLAQAQPFEGDPIARPTVERIRSRVALQSADAASAAHWADLAVQHARLDDRAVETAEGEIVLSRARIALAQRGEASSRLEALATQSVDSGYLAARQSAARELRSIGRRLRPRPGSGFDGLSARERDVALLIVEGFSNNAIAAELHLSEHTVQVHVSRVLAAFGVASRFALAARLSADLPSTVSDAPAPAALTPRQNAVVDRIVLGLSNEQIGRELGVSIKTVEKHVSEVFRRWAVVSRIGVSRLARLRNE